MRSLHCFTELLEFFEWDENRCKRALDDFAVCVNGLSLKDKKALESLESEICQQMKARAWADDEVDFLLEYLKKQLKDEILHEEKHVFNK